MTTNEIHDAPSSDRRVPGEDGVWVLLLGDMAIFAVFFATFMVERSKAPEDFDVARHTLHTGIGLANTLVLLISSLFVVVAVRAVRVDMRQLAGRAIGVSIACGLAFVGLKSYEYADLLETSREVTANDFYSYYYILTGLHLFHVCLGMVVLVALRAQTRRNSLSAKRMAGFEGGACFWHLVDLVWIMMFPLLYLVS